MFDVRFDHVFSIGNNCGCAMLLDDVGLRLTSGPMDWITGATFDSRIKTLCGRFEEFLQLKNIVWHAAGEIDRASDVYRDCQTGDLFVHDFPKAKDLKDSFPEVNAKYQRRIARLLKCLDEGGAFCFVWRDLAKTVSDEDCQWAVECLRKAFPKADCRILILENNLHDRKHAPIAQQGGGGSWIRIRGRFVEEGASDLMGDRPYQRRILHQLKCSATLLRNRRRYALMRGCVRFLSLWHLDREARKAARARWTQRLCRKSVSSTVGW